LLATEQKLYGCAPRSTETSMARTLHGRALAEAPFGGSRQQVAGYDMVVLAPPMQSATLAAERSREAEEPLRQAEEDVARLEERLALIEGSRTWRLRNRVMRFIRRGA
jgi:hypothetical protein